MRKSSNSSHIQERGSGARNPGRLNPNNEGARAPKTRPPQPPKR